jgi:3-oxoacyl-[acyl-carrier protein] reductase
MRIGARRASAPSVQDVPARCAAGIVVPWLPVSAHVLAPTNGGRMTEQNRTILVTGASGGIGHALCTRLANAGHSLVLAARNEARLRAMCDHLSSVRPGSHTWISVDMSSDASVASFAEQLAQRGVILDGAVMMPPQPPPTNDCLPASDTWRSLFQASFIGPLALLKAAISVMRPDPAQGRRSKIVIVSGMSSVQVLGHYATSNVLRCSWLAEAKTIAFALGDRGIHVNTLSLGGTLTPDYSASLEKRAVNAGMSFEQRLAEETSNIPLKKYGTPEEVALAVEVLLSAFSDHMTGMNLLHDGGFTRAY